MRAANSGVMSSSPIRRRPCRRPPAAARPSAAWSRRRALARSVAGGVAAAVVGAARQAIGACRARTSRRRARAAAGAAGRGAGCGRRCGDDGAAGAEPWRVPKTWQARREARQARGAAPTARPARAAARGGGSGRAGGGRRVRVAAQRRRRASRTPTSARRSGGVRGFSCAPRSKISPGPGWILVVGPRCAACAKSCDSSSSCTSRPALAVSPRTSRSRCVSLPFARLFSSNCVSQVSSGSSLLTVSTTASALGNAYLRSSAVL